MMQGSHGLFLYDLIVVADHLRYVGSVMVFSKLRFCKTQHMHKKVLTLHPYFGILTQSLVTSISDFGEIAQLARAHGSYPWCQEFESLSRYMNTKTCGEIHRSFLRREEGGIM